MNDWVEGETYCKREKESARVRFCDAWSFNLSEHDINRYKELKYVTEEATYTIPVEKALVKGFQRTTSAGEEKLFIPIKNWEVKDVG